ncbi:PREDICTED: TNF receptor-associated factor 1, partial [Acanthisitta chloris]|uniref:TNF receptor-associated factor 1 n=1 Tax=Acanthisitta chloris TaxID=57068 RepID=UPI0004F0E6E9
SLQMAENTTRAPQDILSSSPDENEFPFGYPTSICEDVPGQKYLCSNCNNVLRKALQTLCGHRNNKNAICQKCKEEDPNTLSEESLLAEEKQSHSTSSGSNDGCCFSEVGCSFRGSKEEIKEHEKTAVGAHMLLLLQHMRQLKGSLCSAPKAAWKSISNLQIPVGLELDGELEVDCFPGPSASEDESVLQQLLREKMISELENKLQVFENIVAVLNKEVETSHLEITAFRRQSELDQNIIRGLELKIAELHRCLMQKDAGLSSLHKSLLFSEQASYDGVFLWKITDVGRKLQDSVTGRTVGLYSPAFYTAKYGYKVCLRVYLNGDGTGKGTHMSLFFVVMKGDYDALLPWPFRHKVTFMLLDQNNREHIIDAFRPDLTSASYQRPVNDMNVASGCPMFLPLAKLQSPKYAYVKEDTLFLKCIIETN